MGIPTRSYCDEAYTAVKRKIIEGELDFGSRLHIADLAEELGVSSTPIREALNRLSTSGLAEITAHKGVFVVDPSEDDVHELCETRLCLELFMADAVVAKATPQQIEKLRWYTQQTLYETTMTGFHDCYAQIAGNSLLHKFYSQAQGVITVLFGKAIRKHKSEAYVAKHLQEEIRILEAIEQRDVDLLKERIRIHLHNLEEYLLAEKIVKLNQ